MGASKKNMEPGGRNSILFKQRLDYPSKPGQITYYPPEASYDLKNQVKKDKTTGIIFYVIGFIVSMMGLAAALESIDDLQLYSILIPVCLIIGLIAAFFYLYSDNVALAKLSRTLPIILMVALLLLYIGGLVSGALDIASDLDEEDAGVIYEMIEEYIYVRLLAPSFFFITAGLVIARSGGTQLWAATRIVHQYMPATIILETPGKSTVPTRAVTNPCRSCGQSLSYIEEYDRFYCYSCEDYAPLAEDPTPVSKPVATPAVSKPEPKSSKPVPKVPRCKICKDELDFIEEYDRYYCYSCEKYG